MAANLSNDSLQSSSKPGIMGPFSNFSIFIVIEREERGGGGGKRVPSPAWLSSFDEQIYIVNCRDDTKMAVQSKYPKPQWMRAVFGRSAASVDPGVGPSDECCIFIEYDSPKWNSAGLGVGVQAFYGRDLNVRIHRFIHPSIGPMLSRGRTMDEALIWGGFSLSSWGSFEPEGLRSRGSPTILWSYAWYRTSGLL